MFPEEEGLFCRSKLYQLPLLVKVACCSWRTILLNETRTFGRYAWHLDNRQNVSKGSWDSLSIVTSRSHVNEELQVLLNEIDNFNLVSRGSSLKFCLIASGEADIYPRFGLTSEWDIAAGEAIVKFAGGHITNIDNNQLLYNKKESFLNPYFIVSCNEEISEMFLKLSKKKISR